MKIINRISILISMLMLFCFFHCNRSVSPRETLISCLEYIEKGKYEKVYSLFTFKDKSVKNLNEFLRDQQLTEEETSVAEVSGNHTSYEIIESVTLADTARVKLEMIVPDIMANRLAFLFNKVYHMQIIDSIIEPHSGKVYFSKIDGLIVLVKEDNKWRIFGNWEQQRKYQEEEAQYKIAYIQDSILVRNIKIYRSSGDKTSYLTASIFNKGARILDDVELLVVCYSSKNRAVHTKSVHPLLDKKKPLMFSKSRKFKVRLTGVPTNWSGRLEIKVINCQFVN